MRRFIALTLLLLVACQNNQAPSTPSFPNGVPSPRPDGLIDPGTLSDKKEEDIRSKKESWEIKHALFNPSKSHVLYQYDQRYEVNFKEPYGSKAFLTQPSSLMLFNRQTQKHEALTAIQLEESDYSFSIPDVEWLDDQHLIYRGKKETLQIYNIETKKNETFLDKITVRELLVSKGHIFVMAYDTDHWEMIRFKWPERTITRHVLPYQDFYRSGHLYKSSQSISSDLLLMTRMKDMGQRGEYPFKVATTSPPVSDSLIFDFRTGQTKPFEPGLDLLDGTSVQASPGQAYVSLLNNQGESEVYQLSDNRLVLSQKGKLSWLAEQEFVIKDDRQFYHYRLENQQAQLVRQWSTQSHCDVSQSPDPLVLNCSISSASFTPSGFTQRVFYLQDQSGLRELPLQGETISMGTAYQTVLLQNGPDQPLRIVAHIQEEQERSLLLLLKEKAQSETIFTLRSPSKATFMFNNQDNWSMYRYW